MKKWNLNLTISMNFTMTKVILVGLKGHTISFKRCKIRRLFQCPVITLTNKKKLKFGLKETIRNCFKIQSCSHRCQKETDSTKAC
jgi:hypothetical protein